MTNHLQLPSAADPSRVSLHLFTPPLPRLFKTICFCIPPPLHPLSPSYHALLPIVFLNKVPYRLAQRSIFFLPCLSLFILFSPTPNLLSFTDSVASLCLVFTRCLSRRVIDELVRLSQWLSPELCHKHWRVFQQQATENIALWKAFQGFLKFR